MATKKTATKKVPTKKALTIPKEMNNYKYVCVDRIQETVIFSETPPQAGTGYDGDDSLIPMWKHSEPNVWTFTARDMAGDYRIFEDEKFGIFDDSNVLYNSDEALEDLELYTIEDFFKMYPKMIDYVNNKSIASPLKANKKQFPLTSK